MDVIWVLGVASALVVIETALIAWLLRHRAEARRAHRLFETLLADLSATLTQVQTGNFDTALAAALQQTGTFLGMDRGLLHQYAAGVSVESISWTAPGIRPRPSVDDGQLGWTREMLQRGSIVRFSRLAELPASAAGDAQGYERLGIRSHLAIPLRAGGLVLGVLAFDSLRAEREWPGDLVNRLGLLSGAFASALDRRRMELSLGDQVRFHTLLSQLSTAFGNTRAVHFDREMTKALRGIEEFAAADRATIVEFSHGGDAERAWATDEHADHERWRLLLDRVRSGDEVQCGSEVAVPLRAGGSVLGAVLLGADAGRAWAHEFMQQLRLLCEVIASALAAVQAEREAARLRQELAHIGRVSALGELTGSLAHELNQPLTAILNNAEVAQRHVEAPVLDRAALRDILSDIVADDKRAAGVIRRLRTMLKKGELEHVALSVNDVVREVTDLVRNDTTLRHIPVHLDLAAALPAVRGDRAQLQQVVFNMVLNGLEATTASNGRAAGGLVIRTSAHGPDVVVAVEDSGKGIDAEHVDRLFEPLYTTKVNGLGMGLAIARTIVAAHGGTVRAANNHRGGATFEFTLPAAVA